MITQHEFLLACLGGVLRERPSRVVVGDVPIQGCQWDGIVTTAFLKAVDDLVRGGGVPVEIVDFRRTIAPSESLRRICTSARPMNQYIVFDLGRDSLLDPIASEDDRFRVTCYDHRELARTHRPGRHQYLLCREAFDCDVVISLAKPKTHRKAGLTGALKNLVGINGSKEFLPHHRRGGTSGKGDCYPGGSPLRRLAEFFYDTANQRIGRESYTRLEAAWGRRRPFCDRQGRRDGRQLVRKRHLLADGFGPEPDHPVRPKGWHNGFRPPAYGVQSL